MMIMTCVCLTCLPCMCVCILLPQSVSGEGDPFQEHGEEPASNEGLVFDFNSAFQESLEKLQESSVAGMDSEAVLEVYTKLIHLSEDFVTYAKRYGR